MPAKGQMYKKAAPKTSKRPKARPKGLADAGAVARGNNAAKRRARSAMLDKKAGKK